MSNLEKINKSALEYTLHSIPRMKELSKPLHKYFGINSFGYMRTYKDCKYLSLLDGHEGFINSFYERAKKSDPHFIKALQNTPYGEPSYSLWPVNCSSSNSPPILSLLNAHDLWHGFQITYRREEYCEMFSFTFSKQAGDRSAFYMENIPILHKFIASFKTQAADLIEKQHKDNLALYPEKFCTDYIDSNNYKQFLLNLDKSLTLKDLSGNIAHLTYRESECLKILVKNKTCKEIANMLEISPRTVELHIQNIKQKLKINFKSQLIDIYANNFY